VDADQQGGRLRDLLEALDLHPEPVVHQRVEQVLLDLHPPEVLLVERPVAGALGHPAGRARRALAALVGLAGRLARVPDGLRRALLRPAVRPRHTSALPGAAAGHSSCQRRPAARA
jgi:hypothetical protein